ncbi:protein NASP homolog isoform X2 [Sitodiplosis mosellana]|uniref:protein NASP homolog isoform X2 n=1 Tax=Sitodiplosis mosellana TaxID=263140 RepID=UPI0024453196|nr:protein NASP homolog isoform X2 [Sitodiplosis mosellana]
MRYSSNMAEKAPELVTREDKIAQAKELYARGYRNYVVGDFNEAAEDLSRSCELYAELFGDESEEVAVPNLFYGKTLIELAQLGENKLIVLPDADADGDDDDDDDDDDNDDEDEPTLGQDENGEPIEVAAGLVGQKTAREAAGIVLGNEPTNEPQPGTSSGIRNGGDNSIENAEGEANENLQFAWEALEMAARIFRRLGKGHEEYLAEAHYGLAEILMENQNCSEAVRDYNIAFEIFSKMEPIKERCLAEIKYKIGLCNYTTMAYDTSIADFEQSANYMKQAIEAQTAREQTPEVKQTIDDLSKMREDILNKIAEVEETKQLLKSNLMSKSGGYTALLAEDAKSDGTVGSSTEQAQKPKANDISHLIKRKKPDTTNEAANVPDESSPAKKKAI